MGRLTTHVLDTSAGRPAASLKVELREAGRDGAIVETITNSDGRLDAPLLEGERFRVGSYELRFHVGDYFRARGVQLPDPPFLDIVPVRFSMAEEDGHYHVPLLISPFGYSTYRGS